MSSNQKDISIENILIQVPNKTLIHSSNLKITDQRKYGLIGQNGSGKSTLLKAIANRTLDIPSNIDILYVEQEVESSTKTVFETVIESNTKRSELLKELDKYKKQLDDEQDIDILKYNNLHDELNAMNSDKDESIVRSILKGMGFDIHDQDKSTDQFSGGWRMRISLARALYMKPTLLLLDEPTNHLDLNAVIWLTEYLSKWSNTLFVVSHDRNFLNRISTDIMILSESRLKYYRGNYDRYIELNKQDLIHREKEWKKVQSKIREMRKRGTTKKEVDELLLKNEEYKPIRIQKICFDFKKVKLIKSPVVKMTDIVFSYTDKILLNGINLTIDLGTRIAIVGKNGVGKSTLFKLICKELEPLSGQVYTDHRARIGYYNQHSNDVLPNHMTPIEYLETFRIAGQECRRFLGQTGLNSKTHFQLISSLSGGQKARVVFASLISQEPHVIVCDEPTNHLDIESIDALIDGFKEFNGGLVVITHSIDLIERLECNLIELENGECIETIYEEYHSKVMDE